MRYIWLAVVAFALASCKPPVTNQPIENPLVNVYEIKPKVLCAPSASGVIVATDGSVMCPDKTDVDAAIHNAGFDSRFAAFKDPRWKQLAMIFTVRRIDCSVPEDPDDVSTNNEAWGCSMLPTDRNTPDLFQAWVRVAPTAWQTKSIVQHEAGHWHIYFDGGEDIDQFCYDHAEFCKDALDF